MIELTPEQRQYISAVIGAKIPAGELVEAWDQVGPRVRAAWTVRRRPPARVGYADLSARFTGLPGDRVNAEIESALRELVEFLGTDRATLFEFAGDGESLRPTHSWARPPVERHVFRAGGLGSPEFGFVLPTCSVK